MTCSARWAGRLLRGAICGLLATAALPAIASADLGVVNGPPATARAAISIPSISVSNAVHQPQPKSRSNGRNRSAAQTRQLTDSSTSSSTSAFPVTMALPNSCTGETVFISGIETSTSQVQADGSIKFYNDFNGSGSTASGVKYASSDEFHVWLAGPGMTTVTVYDYETLNRVGETGGLVSGDDFFLRFYMNFPIGPGGVPNMNALSTTVTGDCR